MNRSEKTVRIKPKPRIQRLDRVEVEMVGGLVEQQHVRRLEHQRC